MDYCAKIKKLTVAFAGHEVLHEISTEIAKEGVTVLLGRSGSGKTTLLRSLNRLNELFPACETTGSVELLLEGRLREIYGPSAPEPPELRRKTAMVFQSPNPLPLSLRKNIVMPLELTLGLKKAEAEEQLELRLREVGLWEEVKERLDKSALTLSGGQQRRVLIARALAGRPDMLVMDEPTAGVDHANQEALALVLQRLADRGTSMLVVTHELEALEGVVTRIVCLDAGHIDFDGTLAAYADHLRRHAVGSDHHHPDDDSPRRGHVIGAAPLDPTPREVAP